MRAQVAAARGTADGFDLAVWAEVAPSPRRCPAWPPRTRRQGRPGGSRPPSPGPRWWEGITARVGAGVLGERSQETRAASRSLGDQRPACSAASCRSHCSLALATRGGTPSRRNCSPAAAISSMRRSACRTLPCSSRSSVLAEAPASSLRMLSRSHSSHPAALAARSASVTAAARPL